jgi:hypothetical protein
MPKPKTSHLHPTLPGWIHRSYDSKICPYGGIDADECGTIRERSVAGISNTIPDCPVHGPHQEDTNR